MIMQAQQPTSAEVAQDPRLERVIGAILSGAGDMSSSGLIPHRTSFAYPGQCRSAVGCSDISPYCMFHITTCSVSNQVVCPVFQAHFGIAEDVSCFPAVA